LFAQFIESHEWKRHAINNEKPDDEMKEPDNVPVFSDGKKAAQCEEPGLSLSLQPFSY